jgi:hypothetical protein
MPPAWDETMREQLGRLLTELSDLAAPRESAEPQPQVDEKALARAATNLWLSQRKLAQITDGTSRYARQAGRYLNTCWEALRAFGLTVQDHDGDAYHPGRALEVLRFEDDPSLDVERVLRTERPSVYFRGQHIQEAQVIVGCPSTSSDDRPTTDRVGGNHA